MILQDVARDLAQWIDFVVRGQDDKSEGVVKLLRAMHRAANETRHYSASVTVTPAERASAAEDQILQLWVDVGICLSDYALDGADRLYRRHFESTDLWANPKDWQTRDFQQMGSGLDGLVSKVLVLCVPGRGL